MAGTRPDYDDLAVGLQAATQDFESTLHHPAPDQRDIAIAPPAAYKPDSAVFATATSAAYTANGTTLAIQVFCKL